MSLDPSTSRRVAVIGGGIAGLAAAHRVVELDPSCEVTLFEAGPRLGGVLATVHEDGFQVEQSADNFITTIPWGVNLCKRLGLGDQLVQTNPAYRRTLSCVGGGCTALPDGFLMMAPTRLWPLAVTPILSPLGKLRAALEYFIPPRADNGDESMAGVRPPPAGTRGVRPAGRAAGERGLRGRPGEAQRAGHALALSGNGARARQPDPRHASPDEEPAQRPDAKAAHRYSMFVTLRDGLSSLVEALAARLPAGAVQLNTPRHSDRTLRRGVAGVDGRE